MWFKHAHNARSAIVSISTTHAGGARPPVVEMLESRTFFSAALDTAAGPVASSAVSFAMAIGQPQVRSVKPSASAMNVSTEAFVSAELSIPNGGVDASTLTAVNVYLYRVSTKALVPAVVNTSGGGDVIVLKPKSPLAANAQYRFVVTAGVKDVQGVAFTPFSSYFTTGVATAAATTSSPVKFEKAPQATSAGRNYHGMTMGPDGRLYAGCDDGRIYRFDIQADGSLKTPVAFDVIRRKHGGARFVVGLAFDPRSTATNPILWVTHTATSSLLRGGVVGANFTSKVSVISGASLGQYRDAVINLPRSIRDHFTMQPVFGPDGALYFCQASQSSMGKADVIWGNRPERLLSGAILRLDVAALGTKTINALPPDAGGSYDPSAPGAQLTVYADGVRNAFDLLWHRNGHLYAAANGSAAGGNTPAGPAGSAVPSLTNVSKPETDYLFRIVKGGYYGHPNPQRGFYVLNGGNPTAGTDPFEVSDYPVGVKPDPRWKPAIYDLGVHRAPSGSIEYKGNAFGGALNGKMLITRYSGGDDIIALTLNSVGGVAKVETGLPGLTGLTDPVDLVQHPKSGNLYVIELAKQRITLLRAAGTAATAALDADVVIAPADGGAAGDVTAILPTINPPPEPAQPADPAAGTPAVVKPSEPSVAPPSRREQGRLDAIGRLCRRIGAGTPEIAQLRGRDLSTAHRALKRLRAIATARHQTVPDLTGRSINDIQDILSLMKRTPSRLL